MQCFCTFGVDVIMNTIILSSRYRVIDISSVANQVYHIYVIKTT